jgi:hypothetical protein
MGFGFIVLLRLILWPTLMLIGPAVPRLDAPLQATSFFWVIILSPGPPNVRPQFPDRVPRLSTELSPTLSLRLHGWTSYCRSFIIQFGGLQLSIVTTLVQSTFRPIQCSTNAQSILRLICTSSMTKSLLEPSPFCMYRCPLSTLTFSPRGYLHLSSSSFAPV